MIKEKFISKEKINIVFILNENSNIESFEQYFDYISLYLNINIVFMNHEEIMKRLKESNLKFEFIVDFIFVDFIKDYENIFAWNLYSQMHDQNNDFKLILIKNKIENDDIKYFKNGADDIIYTNNEYYDDSHNYLKWKIFSLLRRKWDTSHKNTILNKNGIIIDLIKRVVVVNNKTIKITAREFEILAILVQKYYKDKKYISKNKLFKHIYGINNKINSRAIDQLIFKLKRKLGDNFFEINKYQGIKIS